MNNDPSADQPPKPEDSEDTTASPLPKLVEMESAVAAITMHDVAAQTAIELQQNLAHMAQSVNRFGLDAAWIEEFSTRQRDLARLGTDVASTMAARSAGMSLSENVARLHRLQTEHAERMAEAVRSVADSAWAWIKKAARHAGKKAAELYLQAAPSNWSDDPTTAVLDYGAAGRLSLEEGIPLAWVPDQQTVKELLAVPRNVPNRRATLEAILESRFEIILEYCENRLAQIEASAVSSSHKQMINFARQAIQTLRMGCDAPAQAVAANLLDQLLRETLTVVYGDHSHTKAVQRVETLSEHARGTTLSYLGVLRELATLMPVLTAMKPWYPSQGGPPPTIFNRHATTHHLAAPGQVSRINALIGIMTAVSLLTQQHTSGWSGWKMQRMLEAHKTGNAAAAMPTA